MKPLFLFFAVIAIALSFGTSARAQAVLSPSTNLTTEDQVLTLGTEVFGGDENFTSANLANGVTFQTQLMNATYVGTTLSGITVDTDGSYYGAHANTSAFSDSALNSVLGGDALGNYGQVFVDGLTTGKSYVIQLFAEMTQSGDIGGGTNDPNSVYSGTETVIDETQGGSTTLSYGQTYNPLTGTYSGTGVGFITDTFVATGSQEYLYVENATNGRNLVGALQVRDITDVPEPSTYAMIGLGAAALVLFARFRRFSA